MDSLTNIGHPQQLIQRVADQSLALIPGAEGVLVGVLDDAGSLLFVGGAGYLVSRVGSTEAVEGQLSGMAISSRQILRSDNTENDPRVDRDACRRFGIMSTVCVPLERAFAQLGVLCVSSPRADAFNDQDVATLSELADFTSMVVGASTELSQATSVLLSGWQAEANEPHSTWRPEADDLAALERFVANVLNLETTDALGGRRAIEQMLEEGAFSFAFQPIYDLSTGRVAMVEALARFPLQPHQPPDVWFATAERLGLGVELELAAVKSALESIHFVPDGARMSINVGPHATASSKLLELLASVDPGRVVIELTEQVKVDDYPALRVALMEIRRSGVMLAIDDAGAGYASLSHILKLAPDFIKLDLSLTQGIDVDPVRRALGTSLVNFAQETGARIISEGIETEDELVTLCDLGIHYGQGYLLGRPGPIDSIHHGLPARVLHHTSRNRD